MIKSAPAAEWPLGAVFWRGVVTASSRAKHEQNADVMMKKAPRRFARHARSRPEEASASREPSSPPGVTPDDGRMPEPYGSPAAVLTAAEEPSTGAPEPHESPPFIVPPNEPPGDRAQEPSPLTSSFDETSTNTVSEDLWFRAYAALLKQEPELVRDYECHVGARRDEATTLESRQAALSNPQAVRDIVTALQEERQNKQWKFSVKSKDYKVRDQLENLVKLLSFADGIVKQAVSTQPYAALAWSAVSVFLPVC